MDLTGVIQSPVSENHDWNRSPSQGHGPPCRIVLSFICTAIAITPTRRSQPDTELCERAKGLGIERPGPDRPRQSVRSHRVYSACREAGINRFIATKPMSAPANGRGREARRRGEAGYHLTLLARDRTGFQNLIRMASRAYLEGITTFPASTRNSWPHTKEGSHLPERLRLRPNSANSSSRTSSTRPRSLAEWFANLFGNPSTLNPE